MDCSIPGFFVFHHLPKSPQTHVHGVGDATQPSHPLPPSSPFAFNLSQHQSLSIWRSPEGPAGILAMADPQGSGLSSSDALISMAMEGKAHPEACSLSTQATVSAPRHPRPRDPAWMAASLPWLWRHTG